MLKSALARRWNLHKDTTTWSNKDLTQSAPQPVVANTSTQHQLPNHQETIQSQISDKITISETPLKTKELLQKSLVPNGLSKLQKVGKNIETLLTMLTITLHQTSTVISPHPFPTMEMPELLSVEKAWSNKDLTHHALLLDAQQSSQQLLLKKETLSNTQSDKSLIQMLSTHSQMKALLPIKLVMSGTHQLSEL